MSDKLLKQYRDAAVAHGQGTMSGNHLVANRAYDILRKILEVMCENGSDDELFSLYHDTDISVQIWAAAHTLELNETKAITKLRSIGATEKSILGMGAELTAEEWGKGNLQFRSSK